MEKDNVFANFADMRMLNGLEFILFAIADEHDEFLGLAEVNSNLSRKIQIQAKHEYKYVRRIKNEHDCYGIYVRERLN